MRALEIVVVGVPVSDQTKRRDRREKWKSVVADCASDAIEESDRFEFEPVSVTIIWFTFDWEEGDLDNIAKPILDGLCGPAYSDDQWVTQLTLRRTALSLKTPMEINNPTPKLAEALQNAYEGGGDFVYLRVAKETDHRRLPWM